MVELRSGRRVDLGLVKKAKSHSAAKLTRPLKHQKRADANMSLSFEIYEDDPNAPRPDLVLSPLQSWDDTAVDQENMDPDDEDEPFESQRLPEVTSIAISGGYMQSSYAPAVGSMHTQPRSTSSTRPALHQISQDDDVKPSQKSCSAGNSSKGKESVQANAVQKPPKHKRTPGLLPSIRVQNPNLTQPTAKWVSMLGLR